MISQKWSTIFFIRDVFVLLSNEMKKSARVSSKIENVGADAKL